MAKLRANQSNPKKRCSKSLSIKRSNKKKRKSKSTKKSQNKSTSNNISETGPVCTIFTDLNEFYRNWRKLSSEMLCHCIIIVPNINYEWILDRKNHKYDNENIFDDDDEFIQILKWKHSQELLLCDNIEPFWKHLSSKFVDLKLNPLILDPMYYKSPSFKSKYGVKPVDILIALRSLITKPDIIKEIVYHSNPKLYVAENTESINKEKGLSIDCDSLLKTIDYNSYDIEYSVDSPPTPTATPIPPSPTAISVECYSQKYVYDKEVSCESLPGFNWNERGSITIIPPNYRSTKKDSVLDSREWWIADCYYHDDY